MRTLFIIVLLVASSAGYAQSKADYQRVMTRFVKFYNKKQGDSIVTLFPLKYRNDIKHLWGKKEMDDMHTKYGKIKSFKYKSTDPKAGAVEFQTEFSGLETNGTGMLLSKEKYLETFALFTSEPKPKK